MPGFALPQQPLRAFHLNFGPDWPKGIVSVEPPEIGTPFVVSVPAVDADGNVRAGIRLPDIAVPLATHAGWNYRDASTGAPDRLAGEIGSYIPFARTKADRDRAGDPRLSIEERYRSRDEYVGKFAAAALDLVKQRLPARRGCRRPVEARRRSTTTGRLGLGIRGSGMRACRALRRRSRYFCANAQSADAARYGVPLPAVIGVSGA